MPSIFDNIENGPPIEVFALNKAFLEDNSPDKVNLGVGGEWRSCLVIRSAIDFTTKEKFIEFILKTIDKTPVENSRSNEGHLWIG